MILQRIRIIVGDAGFEPRTSASEVWCATNEPPHLHRGNKIIEVELFNINLFGEAGGTAKPGDNSSIGVRSVTRIFIEAEHRKDRQQCCRTRSCRLCWIGSFLSDNFNLCFFKRIRRSWAKLSRSTLQQWVKKRKKPTARCCFNGHSKCFLKYWDKDSVKLKLIQELTRS